MSAQNRLTASHINQTIEIVVAHVGANKMDPDELVPFIVAVQNSLTQKDSENLQPSVPINQSINSDYIVCLEDGKKLKTLKRHLMTNFQMTPDQYRAKWGLPSDYPMVAPSYAEKRSSLAKNIGLGRHKRNS